MDYHFLFWIAFYMLAIQTDMLSHTYTINREKFTYMLALNRGMLIYTYTVNREI